ncbi:FkbM family methyltransferase [Pseudomonas fluorescens]|uniref:FkbM family methyltransferase n=1 Tax=Pseudomonas fluorescens TaxID=294 RepID=UPI0006420556|nr:FkbM family methyltransferase [Pseudomonas fluorescens]
MKKKLKSIIKGIFNRHYYSNNSYAQEGEDLIVDRILEGKNKGFYLEVGCHHPFRFSNTYFFYKKGWNGLCIDPLPGVGEEFSRWRKRDTIIEKGVSSTEGHLIYYMFNDPALNTFDEALAKKRDGLYGYRLIEKRTIQVSPLSSIIEDSGYNGKIDFLSVDVEGLDIEVLQSNNWEKYRPKIVIAESLSQEVVFFKDRIYQYLQELGYKFYAKTGNSLIFIDARG